MQDLRLEFLRPKMDAMFARKEIFESRTKSNFNSAIKAGREFRNPSICEKLIEKFQIKQYGTNLEKPEKSKAEVGRYKKPYTVHNLDKPQMRHSSTSHHHGNSSRHKRSSHGSDSRHR